MPQPGAIKTYTKALMQIKDNLQSLLQEVFGNAIDGRSIAGSHWLRSVQPLRSVRRSQLPRSVAVVNALLPAAAGDWIELNVA